MTTLSNELIALLFDSQGRLAELHDASGKVRVPIDANGLTDAFEIELRTRAGEVIALTPQADPQIQINGDTLLARWHVAGDWGELDIVGKVALPQGSVLSAWTLEIANRTDCAIWQVAYPRVSGLTDFDGLDGPSWMTVPSEMGEKTANPVHFVNHHEAVITSWSRQQYGCFDTEGGPADIAYSYPGMWALQFVAYGHPAAGGIYFAAHDGQALLKKFGLYQDGGTGEHAALVMKQYPQDRTALGADFASFYPTMIGVYEGDWWNASAIYREWATKQYWCAKGPTRDRKDIPQWAKDLDLWYWNWQFNHIGHPRKLVPIVKHIKERFGCEVAFHWYGSNGEPFSGNWRCPEIYPDSVDLRNILVRGMRELHDAGIRAIPYLEARLWNPDTKSFQDADGMKWITVDEHGKSADEWPGLGHTMCPTAPCFHELIRRIMLQMVDGCEMDGAYIDQVTSCYVVPCFNPDHDHAPGGHDHWVRGYRELSEKVRGDIKSRSNDIIMTSEGVIESLVDLYDLDLARAISNIKGHIGSDDSIPIPLYHSVYHDYHMTYGTVTRFDEPLPEAFRFAEALCLVGGGQLMISGIFAGDEQKEKHQPYLAYMERLARAHVAARKWLNFGVWKPPVSIDCDAVEVKYDANRAPKSDIPAIVNGCFALDGELCIVLVNHTDQPRTGSFTLDLAAYGLEPDAAVLSMLHPEAKDMAKADAGKVAVEASMERASVQVFVVS